MGNSVKREQDEIFSSTKRRKSKIKIRLSKLAKRRNSTCNMTFTSHSTLFVIAIVIGAFALTTGKDAVKNEDLAAQLKEARLESAELRQKSEELHQALEKSKEETKMIIQKENKKLTVEAAKLRKENKKLRRQDKELRQRDAELERKVNELHQDNSEVKKAFRQRDQNNTLELQNVVRNSFGFRQMDFTSELKKTINLQIKEYLDDNKLCVTGYFEEKYLADSGEEKDHKIEFGQTFQRIPAFTAALSAVYLKTADAEPHVKEAHAQVYNFRVTNSSAVVQIYGKHCWNMQVNWIACP